MVCVQGYVSEASLDTALADAPSSTEVNSQRLFTRWRSEAAGRAPSEGQALNTPEHIQKLGLTFG